MTTLRQILILLFLVLAHPYGKTQTSNNEKNITGIWSMPFSYKHEGEVYHGRFFLDISSTENRLRLIETVKIGDRPDAFFARYSGEWYYDGNSLMMSLSNDVKPMFTREIRSELIAAGCDASYIETLESAYESSMPSVQKLGLSGLMSVRELGPKKIVLTSSTTGKALTLQREASLPEVGRFKFLRSEAMESKLAGSWSMNLSSGQHTINLNPKTQSLKGVLTTNDFPGAKAEYVMSWQASKGSIQLEFNDPTIHTTQYGEEISIPSEVNMIMITTLKRQAALSQVFGIAIDVSGDQMNMADINGGRLIWKRVTTPPNTREKNSNGANQTSNSTSNAEQSNTSMGTNSKSNNAQEERADASTEKKLQEEIYTALVDKPKFPGGDEALSATIKSLMKYPPAAAEKFITGRVVVKFVVRSDGSIGDVVLIRPKDPDLDKEAIRIVKQLPNFEPGRMNGTPVAAWYVLPIEFKL